MSATPEQLYSVYHREAVLRTRGFAPRPIVHFDNIKSKPEWKWLEKTADLVNNSNGLIDPEQYIKILVEFYKGFFPLERMCHITSLKLYRTRIDADNVCTDIERIKKLISENIRFVVDFCVGRGIMDFDSYLIDDIELIPSMARHLSSGGVSVFLLALIQKIDGALSSYPVDVRREYFSDFIKRKESLRRLMITDGVLRRLSENIEPFINSQIIAKKEKLT